MHADQLRSQQDRDLFESLLNDVTVKRVNEQIAKREDKGNMGVRRHLLNTSVRLGPEMAPDLHRIANECREALGMTIPLELYVFASPTYNAMCVKPEAGQLFIMFASSLLEAFDADETKFVMGHELGHHLYRHHDIPIGYILRGKSRPSPRLALELTSWSRYAEISADRAGAYCAQNLEAVARSLFKLASGFTGSYGQFELDAFLRQVDEMELESAEPGQGAPTEDWFLTHPFSPLRVKALKFFSESELMPQSDGAPGQSTEDLEVRIQSLMSMMEPSYLEGRTDTAETMRRLLFAAAIVVAKTSNGVSEEEIEIFEKFFGDRSFSDKLDLEKIEAELPERIAQAKEQASQPQLMQVMRDIITVSRADGHTTEAEVERLHEIAHALGISTRFVEQTLAQEPELD